MEIKEIEDIGKLSYTLFARDKKQQSCTITKTKKLRTKTITKTKKIRSKFV